MKKSPIGLYIHVPFCCSKCGYCDFYSVSFNHSTADLYTKRIIDLLNDCEYAFDTVYFGGGTPSVIGDTRIAEILDNINYVENAEITVECNPNTATYQFLQGIKNAGVNRISIGLQSANDNELACLTRKHTSDNVKSAIENAKSAGITNISLDVMLGIQNQTLSSLEKTLSFCILQNVTHISAYMLKIEPNTPFADIDLSVLPNEEQTAQLYEFCRQYLCDNGFNQYEISNFAKPGFESMHNLKYWNCKEYLGLGPAAHSFIDSKRYYYERDLSGFINGKTPKFDAYFSGFEEYAMLKLRLSDGLNFSDAEKDGIDVPSEFIEKCKSLFGSGLIEMDESHIAITKKGFLIQNSILSEILF